MPATHHGHPPRTPTTDTHHGHPPRTPTTDTHHGHPPRTPTTDTHHGHPPRTPTTDTHHGHPPRTPTIPPKLSSTSNSLQTTTNLLPARREGRGILLGRCGLHLIERRTCQLVGNHGIRHRNGRNTRFDLGWFEVGC